MRNAGDPKTIRVYNSSEIISRDLDLWAYANDVTLDFSRPGKPKDNAFIEAFNSKFRTECLNAHWLLTLADAREELEDWRRYCNNRCAHDPSTFGHVASLCEELVETGKQVFNCMGLRQLFAKQLDHLGVRNPVIQSQPEEPHEGQSIIDDGLGLVIGKIVHRPKHQDLEHLYSIKRWSATLGTIGSFQCLGQWFAENSHGTTELSFSNGSPASHSQT